MNDGKDKNQEQKQSGKQEKERKGRSAAEIIITAISGAIVLLLIGFSIYHEVLTEGTPPTVTAEPIMDQVVRRDGYYVLPVEIRNRTRPTAQDVRVVVTATPPSGRVGRNELLISYLPEYSRTTAYVALRQDPRKTRVIAEVQSFQLQ